MKIVIPCGAADPSLNGVLIPPVLETMVPALRAARHEPWLIGPDPMDESMAGIATHRIAGSDGRREGELITDGLLRSLGTAVADDEPFALLNIHFPALRTERILEACRSYPTEHPELWVSALPSPEIVPFLTLPLRKMRMGIKFNEPLSLEVHDVDRAFFRVTAIDAQGKAYETGWLDLAHHAKIGEVQTFVCHESKFIPVCLGLHWNTIPTMSFTFQSPHPFEELRLDLAEESTLNHDAIYPRISMAPFWITNSAEGKTFRFQDHAIIQGRQECPPFREFSEALIIGTLPLLAALHQKSPGLRIREIPLAEEEAPRITTPLDWLRYSVSRKTPASEMTYARRD